MRVSTLTVCALAAFAAQDWNQQAIAAADASFSPDSKSTSEATSVSAGESTSEPAQAIALPETFVAESLPETITRNSTDETRDAIADDISSKPNQLFTAEESETLITQAAPSHRANANGAIDIPVQTPPSQQNATMTAQVQVQPPVRVTTPIRVSIEGQELPVPGALPLSFRFPIRTRIVSNPAITTNTPITDQEFPNPLPSANIGSLEELARYREARTVAINIWAEEVRGCMVGEYPNMVSLRRVRQADGTYIDQQIPVLFNGNRGRIVTNANGQLVCPV